MSKPIIETVLFKLKDGVRDLDFRSTLPASTLLWGVAQAFGLAAFRFRKMANGSNISNGPT